MIYDTTVDAVFYFNGNDWVMLIQLTWISAKVLVRGPWFILRGHLLTYVELLK